MPKPILPPELAAELAPATLLVRGGSERSAYEETSEALFLTSGFVYGSAAEAEAAFKQDGSRYVYSRYRNPTVTMFEDRPEFIALQHVLVMRMQPRGGEVSDPIVVRHWRQEWRHEAEAVLAYEGANTWARRAVPAAARRGAWTQTVLQVDDSPRYAARGRWEHGDGVSTWISDETWRPLPRREFSVRKDYDVLVGTNRHTITPQGWVQEENNLKLVLAEQRYLAREYGEHELEVVLLLH